MKIKARVGASQDTNYLTFDLEDMGVDQQDWDALTDEEKSKLVQDAVNDHPDQPYWIVESFDEK